jgi:hypothetical protein
MEQKQSSQSTVRNHLLSVQSASPYVFHHVSTAFYPAYSCESGYRRVLIRRHWMDVFTFIGASYTRKYLFSKQWG